MDNKYKQAYKVPPGPGELEAELTRLKREIENHYVPGWTGDRIKLAEAREALRACEREMIAAAQSEYTGGDDYHEALRRAKEVLGEHATHRTCKSFQGKWCRLKAGHDGECTY